MQVATPDGGLIFISFYTKLINEFLPEQTLQLLRHHSDEELLKLIRASDKAAYEEIFHRYWYRLYRMVFKSTGEHEEAEEIVQELFLKLWKRREELKVVNLSHYLLGSVRKQLIDNIRSKIVHQKYWDHYRAFIPTSANETDSAVAFDELNAEIQQAIKQLPEKSQQVFRLNRLEGRSISEIAQFLKLSERAIEYHLTQSLKQLRAHLKDYIISLLLWVFLF